MRALQLVSDREVKVTDVEAPPPPGEGEVQLKIRVVALNHIDVWGWRGMAFAKRNLPLVVGAEASGVIESVGPGVSGLSTGQLVSIYGANT
ncbi:MAG: alcohol dehydrogenase catalytic domain-containing protein, partial [Nitratireductor sp.]|nr:alcohol dehydrogenase catalytic domain-containing protein [Nitratireductor sp.]